MEWLHAPSYPLFIITIIDSTSSQELKYRLSRDYSEELVLCITKQKRTGLLKNIYNPGTVQHLTPILQAIVQVADGTTSYPCRMQGTLNGLENFIGHLNSNDQNIKLTHVISQSSLEFLDIRILKDDWGRISTDVHRNSTSDDALLHASSFHPMHTIRAIPTGQFLRMKRICNTEQYFEYQARDLKTRFKQGGYRTDDIERAYFRAKNTDRTSLLVPRRRDSSGSQVARCKGLWHR